MPRVVTPTLAQLRRLIGFSEEARTTLIVYRMQRALYRGEPVLAYEIAPGIVTGAIAWNEIPTTPPGVHVRSLFVDPRSRRQSVARVLWRAMRARYASDATVLTAPTSAFAGALFFASQGLPLWGYTDRGEIVAGQGLPSDATWQQLVPEHLKQCPSCDRLYDVLLCPHCELTRTSIQWSLVDDLA